MFNKTLLIAALSLFAAVGASACEEPKAPKPAHWLACSCGKSHSGGSLIASSCKKKDKRIDVEQSLISCECEQVESDEVMV